MTARLVLRRSAAGVAALLTGTGAALALADGPQVQTVAGNGETTGAVGATALATPMAPEFGVAVKPDGTIVFSEPQRHRVRAVLPDGTVVPVAGNGDRGSGGDGGPASVAELNEPFGVDVGPDGSVFVAEARGHRIRRVAPDGTISTVAGTGTSGFTGDGGPATAAEISGPLDVAAQADGGLVVADSHNNRVRRVAPDGTISTIAGTGEATSCADDPQGCRQGDGGPATAAQLSAFAVALAPDGSIVVADKARRLVRRISRFGTLTTLAGTGIAPPEGIGSGDGGPAAEADFMSVDDVVVTASGDVVVVDAFAHRLRRIDADRRIGAYAGTGERGFSGDGGPAPAARFDFVSGAALAPDGSLVVADSGNARLRRVGAPGGPATSPPANTPGTTQSTTTITQTVTTTVERTVTVPAPPPPSREERPVLTVPRRLGPAAFRAPGAIAVRCVVACRPTVELRDARRRVLARGTAPRAAAGRLRVVLAPTAEGRRVLRPGRRVRATLAVVVAGRDGTVVLRTERRTVAGR